MHELYLIVGIGGTVMMSMFAAAYAAKFEAVARITDPSVQHAMLETDIF